MAESGPRPNVIVILADDMGYSDLGCYGAEIRTPNLDRMAERGLLFSQFYNTPRCCPSRASLLTGLYPHQGGIGHMTGDYNRPGYRGFLNDRCVTIAEALRLGGYRTLMSGKWHVGQRRQMAINDQPFKPEGDDFYMTDFITDRAVEFIEKHGRDEWPFFLYVAYTAPHWPLHAWPEDIARYTGKYAEGWDELREERLARQIELGLIEERWPLTPRDPNAPAWAEVENKEALDLKMAVYAAQVDNMDQGVGEILAKLREMNIEQNTLVMFLSDNGGCAEEIDSGEPGVPPGPKESFLSYGLPWANASNAPFRLYKHWVHEGGIATPFIVQWPAGIRNGGRMTHQAAHIIDIMATCLDVAGVQYPETYDGKEVEPLEGRSFRAIFDDKAWEGHDVLFWEHEGNKAVRQGRWKLVCKYPGEWELYDMAADRTELDDLKDRHSDKAGELAALYEEWARRCNVEPWPVKK